MKRRRRAILLISAVLIALSLLAVAYKCTSEPPTPGETSSPVDTAMPIVETQVVEASPPSVVTPIVEAPLSGDGMPEVEPPTPPLVFGYMEQGKEEAKILEQLGSFESSSGGVVGQQYGTPDALVDAFLAGQVHVAALAYSQVGLLYKQGVLMTLDYLDTGILPDARNSVTFGGYVYGLPWRRSACMAHYYYLVVNEVAPHVDALPLIQFLADGYQQEERRDLPGWFPTLECCYEDGLCSSPGYCGQKIRCPELPTVIRLEPEKIESTIALANERLPHLNAVLGQIKINTAGAVSLFYESERQSTAVALADPVPTDGFRTKLRTEGAYVGALFVDSDPIYPPGDYAVWWKCDRQPCIERNSQVKVYLIPPGLNGKPRVIPVQFERFVDHGGQVGPPFSQVEEGSRWICWHVDGLRGCIRVGRR